MTEAKLLLISFLLLVFFGAEKVATDSSCSDDELYVIRSSGSGGQLVLDASEPPDVRVQYFTGYSSQLWQFKRGSRVGLYYIINNYTGNALDFVTTKTDHELRTTKQKTNSMQQQWDLALNGRIINASLMKNVDVKGAIYNSGTLVILQTDNGNNAQKFDLQLMGIRPNLDLCKYLLR